MGAGSLDVIKPSAAGLVATTGAGRRPPPGCPPAGPVRVRGGGRSAAGAPGGAGGAAGDRDLDRLFAPPALEPPLAEGVLDVAHQSFEHLKRLVLVLA